jgi:hypothetical protein
MKTRLGIFIATLLLMPLAGLFLSGAQWSDLTSASSANEGSIAATLRTSIMLLVYVLLINLFIKRITGNSPFSAQKNYYIGVSIASVVLCGLLSYLNLFVASWTVEQDNSLIVQILLYTPLFALLAPAVLVTRALLGSFPGLLKSLTCRVTFPAASGETLARILVPVAIFGLLGGAAWPAKLFWLLWISPLLLLIAMQFLWHESSIFARVKSGDWGRIVCTALSGIIVGNLAVISYQANASLDINLPNIWVAQAGLALFGLTCLQLGDVIAENWRGKSRTAMFQQKKKFPIPVVVRKN